MLLSRYCSLYYVMPWRQGRRSKCVLTQFPDFWKAKILWKSSPAFPWRFQWPYGRTATSLTDSLRTINQFARVEKKDSRLIVGYVSRHCFLQLTDCLFGCKTQTSDFDRGMLVDICNCVSNQIKLCKVFIMAVRITVGSLLSKRMGDPLMSLIYGKQHYVFTRLDLLNTEIFHSSLSIIFCDKCSR